LQVFKYIVLLLAFVLPVFLKADTELHFRDGSPEWHNFLHRKIDSMPSLKNADSLHQVLINHGFPNCDITSGIIEGSTIIDIEFGTEFYIGSLIIEGDLEDTIVCNKQFIESEYEILIDSILQSFKDQGFYFVNLLAQSYQADNNRVNILLYLQTGPIVEVSSAESAGIKKTEPKLLRCYLEIQDGDSLNSERIAESWERLKSIDFVSSTDPPEIIPEPGYNKARVRFSLSEMKTINIEGAGAYIPGDNGDLVGYLNFGAHNYFGGGRILSLLIDKREKNRSARQLLYSQPLFLLGYGRAEFMLSTRDYRNQFYEFSLNGTYNFEIGRNLKARFNLGWKDLEPGADIFQAYDVYIAGFGIDMGKMDKKFNHDPQFLFGWEIGYYSRHYKADGDDSVSTRSDIYDTRNKIIAQTTLNLFAFTLLHLKINFLDVSSSEKPLPISERFLFGGLSGLRGYRNDQFSARRLLIFELEPRLYFSPDNYFYPFADAAYYEYYNLNESGNFGKFDDFIFGYGFGFNLNSESHSLKISLSWGEDTPFDQPRLNVGLSNNF